MTPSIIRSTLCAAALLAAGQAHAQLVEIKFDDAGRFEHSASLAAGKAIEVCGKLLKGQALPWSFTADKPLQFNIHYHVGKKVEFPAKLQSAKAADAQLDVTLDQDYCWMWTNKGDAEAKLGFKLQK